MKNPQSTHEQYALKHLAEFISLDEALTQLPRQIINEYDAFTLKNFCNEFLDDLPSWVLGVEQSDCAKVSEDCTITIRHQPTKWLFSQADVEDADVYLYFDECFAPRIDCVTEGYIAYSEDFIPESIVTYTYKGIKVNSNGERMILKKPYVIITAMISHVRYRIAQDAAMIDIQKAPYEESMRVLSRRHRQRAISAIRQYFHAKASRNNPIQ